MSRDLPKVDDGRRLDADALVDRAVARHSALESATSGLGIELYHRAALTVRAAIGRDGESIVRRHGADEGSALRATSPAGNQLAFAATTGSDAESLCRVLDLAGRHPSGVPRRELWSRAAGEPLLDRDAEPALPTEDEVTQWLRRARAALVSPVEPLIDAWVEVVHTAETWVADGGLRGSRVRTRGSAFMRHAVAESRPVLIASRSFERLPVDGWQAVLDDRRLAAQTAKPPPTRSIQVLFNPECSAILVQALVRTLHHGELDLVVGPAWRVMDDPAGSAAVWGGTFDDAGFETRRTILADGRRACGALDGAGHFRRPSFRDRPAPSPSHLVVGAAGSDLPDRCLLATGLRLHAIDAERWLLRIDGAWLERGVPGSALHPSHVTVSASELVRRCVAAVGPARSSYRGVETPALVFDGLTLQSC